MCQKEISDKWKKAVLNLGCSSCEQYLSEIEKENQLRNKFIKNDITSKELSEKYKIIWEENKTYNKNYGTALFLSHNSKTYILTSRHVIWDNKSAEQEFKQIREEIEENRDKELFQKATKNIENRIFNIIYMAPSSNVQSINNNSRSNYLTNLRSEQYTLTNEDVDLALISLDHYDSYFSNGLLSMGYEPISSKDIADNIPNEGTEIFTVVILNFLQYLFILKANY